MVDFGACDIVWLIGHSIERIPTLRTKETPSPAKLAIQRVGPYQHSMSHPTISYDNVLGQMLHSVHS